MPDTPAQNITEAADRIRKQRTAAARVSAELAAAREAERAAELAARTDAGGQQ